MIAFLRLRAPTSGLALWLALITLLPLVAVGTTLAQESAEEGGVLVFEAARIRGNQELPNVLYVIPWRPLERGEMRNEETLGSLVDSGRGKPLYREEFRRVVNYYDVFHAVHIEPPQEVKP